MSEETPTASSSEQKNVENVDTEIVSMDHIGNLEQRNNNNNVIMISIQNYGAYTLNTNLSMEVISSPYLHIIGLNPILSDVPDSGTTDDDDSDYGYENNDLNSDNQDVTPPSGEQDNSNVDATNNEKEDIKDTNDECEKTINNDDPIPVPSSSSVKEENSELDTLTLKIKNPDGGESSGTESVKRRTENSVPLKKIKKF